MGKVEGLILPTSIGKEDSTVAETIVLVLSQEWPLSAKAIHRRIKNKHNVTFQAVHKAANSLLEKGVLKKEDRKYSINLYWIDKIINFGNGIKEKYSGCKARINIPADKYLISTTLDKKIFVMEEANDYNAEMFSYK